MYIETNSARRVDMQEKPSGVSRCFFAALRYIANVAPFIVLAGADGVSHGETKEPTKRQGQNRKWE